MSIAASFVIAPNWKLPRCPSVGERLNKPGKPTQQQKGRDFTHATIWMNLRTIMVNPKSQSQKDTFCMISSM